MRKAANGLVCLGLAAELAAATAWAPVPAWAAAVFFALFVVFSVTGAMRLTDAAAAFANDRELRARLTVLTALAGGRWARPFEIERVGLLSRRRVARALGQLETQGMVRGMWPETQGRTPPVRVFQKVEVHRFAPVNISVPVISAKVVADNMAWLRDRIERSLAGGPHEFVAPGEGKNPKKKKRKR